MGRVENIVHELNVTGLRCPLPLLKAKKVLNEMEKGSVLKVLATDPGSQRDFVVYVDQSAHELLGSGEENGVFTYIIRKG